MTIEVLVMVLGLIATLVGWGIMLGTTRNTVSTVKEDIAEIKQDGKDTNAEVRTVRMEVAELRGEFQTQTDRVNQLERKRTGKRI